MSVRLKLILSFVLVVVVSIASMNIVALRSNTNEVQTFMFHAGMGNDPGIVTNLEAYYQRIGSWSGVDTILQNTGGGAGFGPGPGGFGPMAGMMSHQLILADSQGLIIFDSNGSQTGQLLDKNSLNQGAALQVNGKNVGTLIIQGGMRFTVNEERFLVSRLSQAALTSAIIAGLLSLMIAFFLAARLFRPIDALARAAARLGGGDLSQRVPEKGDDEFARLARTFNRMADALQQAETNRRAMTADIAHELRNPLAVQRASLEALQDGIYPLKVESLQPILDQNLLLTKLVDDLQTLALADAGQLKLEIIPCDIQELVEQVRQRFLPQASSKGIEIQVEKPAAEVAKEALVACDALRVEQILSNLISNGLRYTPEHGVIVIRIEYTQLMGIIRVGNSGPGIPVEALPHIFERFYRADRSRSRVDGGSGLGLAIARKLAEAQGGTLTAVNEPPKRGATFTLTLPRVQYHEAE